MSALIATFGAGLVIKIFTCGATAILALGGMFLVKRTIESSGQAKQRAADTQKGMDDVETTSKVRTDVDALGDARLNKRLQPFERK